MRRTLCGTVLHLAFTGPQVSEVTHLTIIEISPRLHSVLQPRDPGVKFLEIVVALELRKSVRFHYGDVW